MIDINRTTIAHRRDDSPNFSLQSNALVLDNGLASEASSSYPCANIMSRRPEALQNPLHQEEHPRILLIGHAATDSGSLKARIEQVTGWQVMETAAIPDGLRALLRPRIKIEIVVLTINRNPNLATRFIENLNRLGAAGRIARPRVLALSNACQPPEFATRLEKLGIQLLLRRYSDQVVEAIKRLQWQARRTNGLPTVIIDRRGGQVVGARVSYRGVTEHMRIGSRLCALAAYLAIHRKSKHTTEMLANVLGISLTSLKEYLKRLRRAYDLIRVKLGNPLRGKDVFWTKRMPGGFVHGLKANVEIEDSDEFFFLEEDRHTEAAELPCHVCHRRNPRSETTWSQSGWVCRECAVELEAIGEL